MHHGQCTAGFTQDCNAHGSPAYQCRAIHAHVQCLFQVLAQLTTSSTNVSENYAKCQNINATARATREECFPEVVCGETGFALTVALVAITATICLILGWWNASLESKETKTKQQEIQHVMRKLARGVKATADASKETMAAVKDTLAKMEQQTVITVQDPAVLRQQQLQPQPQQQPQQQQPQLLRQQQQQLQRSMTEGAFNPRFSRRDKAPQGLLPELSSLVTAGPSSGTTAGIEGISEAATVDTSNPLQGPALDGLDKSPVRAFTEKLIRTLGGTIIFLVLALFTPPVSSCLLPSVHKQVSCCRSGSQFDMHMMVSP